jgi:hypothetical protein
MVRIEGQLRFSENILTFSLTKMILSRSFLAL